MAANGTPVPPPAPPKSPERPRRRRTLLGVALGLLGLALLVFLATPSVLSFFARAKLRSELGERLHAQVRIGTLSLGWSGRGELRDLKVVPYGFTDPLLTVRRVDLKVSPGAALKGRLVGRVVVYHPDVFLERHADGRANYEPPEVARRPRAPRKKRPGEPPEVNFDVEVRNASLRGRGIGPDAAPESETIRASLDRLDASLRSAGGAVSGQITLTGFEWADPRTTVREPIVSLACALVVSPSRIEVRAMELSSQAVEGRVSGAVAIGGSSDEESALRGSLRYVPESVGAVASPWIPVRLEGAEPRKVEFELAGRAAGTGLAGVLRGAKGRLAADVPRLSRPGLTVSGRLVATLESGALRGTAPLEVNGGRVDLQFGVDVREPLRASGGRLELRARDVGASAALAPLLEKLSPVFCTAAGELAGAVTADFDFAWAGVPEAREESCLAVVSRALQGRGSIGVRGLRVVGSPAVDILSDALELAGRRLEGELRPVEISIDGGRCSYSGMTFVTQRFPIRFSGWVGFDRRMDLTVELPVGQRLARRFPGLSRILGDTLRVPLRGRVDRPRLDLEEAVSRLLREHGDGTLRDEATEFLEDFLRGRPSR